ncbi:MAG: hypothetical protein QS748_03865 [Candidatus Endonucleobacter bathymodioli]|uniref:Uncharacterized protein n=1 Tax=Candidatus Endonucleibacter bathymodioli TaxID=539814 RepID=A0AA90SLY6_9GAMM|nr:hypothetical protein [Candidatus Endonucleobacter bathymodioli]
MRGMFCKLKFCCRSIFVYSKFIKNITCLLISVCIFNVYAEQSYTTLDAQSYQKNTEKNWFYEKYDSVKSWAGSYFNSVNMAGVSEYGNSINNSIRHLKDMFDENNLYGELEKLKEKNVFEVLAMVYMRLLLEANVLDQDIIKSGLASPDWIINFRYITQQIKKESGLYLQESEKTKFELLTNEGKMAAEEEFNSRANQCYSKFQSLFLYQVKDEITNSLIKTKLDKQVSLLASKNRSNTEFFTEVTSTQPDALLNALLTTYVVAAISNSPSVPQFPVLEALVNWSMDNEDSKIRKLLDDSKSWYNKNHPVVAKESKDNEINKNNQIFFCYLNNNSETELSDANQSSLNLETREITAGLLADNIIKNVICEFTTVQQLAAACRNGYSSLDAMHHNREQQENLSPEQKAKNKKERQKGEFSQADMDEYLQEGMAANIKDSLFGKITSSISYAFNAIKSNFVTTPTKQDKSKKVVTDWIKLVQKHALKVRGGATHKSIKSVMIELESIDKQYTGGNITIADALAALVKQRFNSDTQGEAFTLLTGMVCKSNEQQKDYFSDQAFLCNESTNKDVNNNVYGNKKYGLGVAKIDNILHKPDFDQQNCNTDTSDDQFDDPYLHQDWRIIKVEYDEKSDDYQCSKSRTFYFGSAKGLGSTFGKLIALALPIFIIANAIPGSYSTLVSSPMINITNAEELSITGINSTHSSSGNYKLIDKFDAHNFTNPISYFSGFDKYRHTRDTSESFSIGANQLRCPEPPEWKFVERVTCGGLLSNHSLMCISDVTPPIYECPLIHNNYRYFCLSAIEKTRQGTMLIARYNSFTPGCCCKEFYQPFTWSSNETYTCTFQKSLCSEEGQYIYDKDKYVPNDPKNIYRIATDNVCSCDYTNGYDFIVPPTNGCYCDPITEDCSCYKKTCPKDAKLTPDHECITYKTPKYDFICQKRVTHGVKPTIESSHSKYDMAFPSSSGRQSFLITVTSLAFFTIVGGAVSMNYILNDEVKKIKQEVRTSVARCVHNIRKIRNIRNIRNIRKEELGVDPLDSSEIMRYGEIIIVPKKDDGTVSMGARSESVSDATNNQTIAILELADEDESDESFIQALEYPPDEN